MRAFLDRLGITSAWSAKRRRDVLLGVRKPPLITRLLPVMIVLLFFLVALALFVYAL